MAQSSLPFLPFHPLRPHIASLHHPVSSCRSFTSYIFTYSHSFPPSRSHFFTLHLPNFIPTPSLSLFSCKSLLISLETLVFEPLALDFPT